MRLRNQRRDKPIWWRNEDEAHVTTTRRHLDEPFTAFDAGFAVGAAIPDSTRFGLTVTPEGQSYWLDTPDQLIALR
jgi:hypothetical protein